MNTSFRAEPANNYGLDDWRVVFIRADHKRIKNQTCGSSWSYEKKSRVNKRPVWSQDFFVISEVWFGLFSIGQLHASQIILIFNIRNLTYI